MMNEQKFIGTTYLVVPEAGLDLVLDIAMCAKTKDVNGVVTAYYTLRELSSNADNSFKALPLGNGYFKCALQLSDAFGSEPEVVKAAVRLVFDDPDLSGVESRLTCWWIYNNVEMREAESSALMLKRNIDEV